MYTTVKGVKIVGMAAAVSNKWESLEDASDEDEAVIRKFVKKIGVEGRYSAGPRQTSADFCYSAAKELLAKKEIDLSEVGVLVYVTQTGDYAAPAGACVLQDRLGIDSSCIAFDVNLGCSGFVCGMQIITTLLQASSCKYALLLAGDTAAREKSERTSVRLSHSASLLFGDCGTATLLEKTTEEATPPLLFSANTDGSGFKAIIDPYGGWRNPDTPEGTIAESVMDDITVFNFATGKVPEQINDYMAVQGTTAADYDCLVLHQANLMIMKRIAKKTGFASEKMPLSITKFANTSSASIPVTLVDAYGDCNDEGGVRSLCCGFGVGLSWATVDLQIEKRDILPLVHTDEYFVDGYPHPGE